MYEKMRFIYEKINYVNHMENNLFKDLNGPILFFKYLKICSSMPICI